MDISGWVTSAITGIGIFAAIGSAIYARIQARAAKKSADYAESQAESAAKSAKIEEDRRHDETIPSFLFEMYDYNLYGSGSEFRALLRVTLNGPKGIHHISNTKIRIINTYGNLYEFSFVKGANATFSHEKEVIEGGSFDVAIYGSLDIRENNGEPKVALEITAGKDGKYWKPIIEYCKYNCKS